MDFYKQHREKLRTPEEAVRAVKSGDWVDYTSGVGFPILLDEALAKRKEELTDVKIRGTLIFGPLRTVECDPDREHFIYNSWHFSSYERKLSDRGLCSFMPMIFRFMPEYYRALLKVNVVMLCARPMDRHGYFNLSCTAGVAKGIIESADIVIIEVNERLPHILGGYDESLHISEVDYVVEGEHPPLPALPAGEATKEETAIAEAVIPYIPSGATLQLGIGHIPDVIGRRIADSDITDLGMHTELCSDAFHVMYEAGKLTNRRKQIHRDKGVTAMVVGSQPLYDWLDHNPGIMIAPVSYVNNPAVIGQMDNMISVNNCIAVDLYGQVSAEGAGSRHISGTGGQLDFLTGTTISRGGKSFLCMTSSYVNKKGERTSRVVPRFMGDVVTDPRSQTHLIATEYGVVNLIGKTTWERAELLISVAHPDFRDSLIEAAQEQNIWRQSNKR